MSVTSKIPNYLRKLRIETQHWNNARDRNVRTHKYFFESYKNAQTIFRTMRVVLRVDFIPRIPCASYERSIC